MADYGQTWPQNRKYETYRIVTRGGPNHRAIGNMHRKIGEGWTSGIRDNARGQTERHTKLQTDIQTYRQSETYTLITVLHKYILNYTLKLTFEHRPNSIGLEHRSYPVTYTVNLFES